VPSAVWGAGLAEHDVARPRRGLDDGIAEPVERIIDDTLGVILGVILEGALVRAEQG